MILKFEKPSYLLNAEYRQRQRLRLCHVFVSKIWNFVNIVQLLFDKIVNNGIIRVYINISTPIEGVFSRNKNKLEKRI